MSKDARINSVGKVLCVAMLAAWLALPGRALAQDSATPATPPTRGGAAAKSPNAGKSRELLLFEQASDAEGKGDYDKAVVLLEEAIEIAPPPSTSKPNLPGSACSRLSDVNASSIARAIGRTSKA
mgnify:CR=1 FL=1